MHTSAYDSTWRRQTPRNYDWHFQFSPNRIHNTQHSKIQILKLTLGSGHYRTNTKTDGQKGWVFYHIFLEYSTFKTIKGSQLWSFIKRQFKNRLNGGILQTWWVELIVLTRQAHSAYPSTSWNLKHDRITLACKLKQSLQHSHTWENTHNLLT